MKLKIIFLAIVFCITKINGQKKYEANWESLKNYAAPEWYEDAKLGYWVHWGVYSVPAFKGDHAAEWYGRWMYSQKGQSSRNNQGYATHLHHNNTYGPPEEFGYKDFIPMFKAEKFNAKEWADLFEQGGAKFFTMMAAHHDTFCLWDTKLSKWNAVNMGPKRDLVGEIATAVRKKGMKFGVSNHTAWNHAFFQWNHINRYDATNPENEDLYGNPIIPKSSDTIRIGVNEKRNDWLKRSRWNLVQPSNRDLTRWLARTKELASMYQPDLYYFDWGINPTVWEPWRKEFAAYYYNNAVENGQGFYGSPNVVLNYKNQKTFKPGSAVRDFEHGAFDDIHDMVWQTDESVYLGHNWGYGEGIPVKPTNMIVDQFMDIISKRGVLMLSFAPRADGSFPKDQKKLMLELGEWLRICGEAVYATRPYEVFGELGEHWVERDEHGHKKYMATSRDVRFTRNKENNVLYATVLDWPEDGKVLIKSLANVNLKDLESIQLLGSKRELSYKQKNEGLEVFLRKKPKYKFAYPIKLSFKNVIPQSTK